MRMEGRRWWRGGGAGGGGHGGLRHYGRVHLPVPGGLARGGQHLTHQGHPRASYQSWGLMGLV